jgi:signal transduction histidine kinase
VQDIYSQVQRQEYWFVGATLTMILLMSLYLIRSNRRLFAELASLSDERREFARQLIETRESTLHEISRELHDEFGQILTAMGAMIGRAGRHVPPDSPLQAELHEIREIAQTTLDNVRGLSQTLHPSILEEAGLEGTIEWYLPTVERQTGLAVSYERSGPSVEIPNTIAIHVYRVLQEALNNVARHAGSNRAWVRLRSSANRLELEVEDHGAGLASTAGRAPGTSDANGSRRGLGLVAMRERAAIVGGTIEFVNVPEGGTLVRLTVPLDKIESNANLPPSPGSGETRRSASRGGGQVGHAQHR